MRNLLLRLARRILAPGVLIGALVLPAASASAQTSPFVGPIQFLNATQLVLNGSFEDPTAVTPSGAATWDLQRGANYTILSSLGVIHPLCKNSPGAMYLAGFSGPGVVTLVQDAGFITQQLSIPAGASGAGATLEYWLYFPNQLQEREELVAKAVDLAKLPDPFSFSPVPWVTLATSSNQTTIKTSGSILARWPCPSSRARRSCCDSRRVPTSSIPSCHRRCPS